MSIPLVSFSPRIPTRLTKDVWFVATWFLAFWTFGSVQPWALGQTDQLDPAAVQFFEQNIRPLLIMHCQECHSQDTQASGGLRLDSRVGWEMGGDSGPAILPGDHQQSLLWRAISYEDPDLQMPPAGKLSAEELHYIQTWIQNQAVDPREETTAAEPTHQPLAPSDAQQHWAYRPLERPSVPESKNNDLHPIDRFINRQLQEHGITALDQATSAAIWRRLNYDLSGLPPELHRDLPLASHSGEFHQLYLAQVEQLLAAETFGETFARHWMDVVRYADSVTLRGFVLPNAWRYRDYLIEAYNLDKPFNQMITEQIAGDRLPRPSVAELADPVMWHRYRQSLIATTFLTLGNTNLETQDKRALELDYIDEQLDVIGQAFLAQTISCARCHDHKFDPIPTRDYYALAKILDGSIGLVHDNVSTWVETPLPSSVEEELVRANLTSRISAADQELAILKAKLAPVDQQRNIPVHALPGVVLDDNQAQLVGDWVVSQHKAPFLETGYRHDAATSRGQKTATFQTQALPPGKYDVRISYSTGSNRATNVMVDVFSADGQTTLRVNQQQRPNVDGIWHSLGSFRFETNGQAYVMVSNQAADGHVIIDGVQFLPIVETLPSNETKQDNSSPAATDINQPIFDPTAEIRAAVARLEGQRREWQQQVDAQPKFMSLRQQTEPSNLPILIRGDHKRPGPVVERGFLSANGFPATISIPETSDGRLELAHWLTDRRNPLTARVYVNRIWSWLMGQGLVPSLNNFGTTGSPPTHPELLDWLACELIDNNWSTKHLVRLIVTSDAYQRSVAQQASEADPNNQWYGSGHRRRLSVEALRDSMLWISGELDQQRGGSTVSPQTVADYDYQHESLRRSVYQPVFRNALPPLYGEFDFADPGRSIGQRNRTTIPAQGLVLLNSTWVSERAKAAAKRIRQMCSESSAAEDTANALVQTAYQQCLGRLATDDELRIGRVYLETIGPEGYDPLVDLVQALFGSLEFRFVE
jgi:hypothetical protein